MKNEERRKPPRLNNKNPFIELFFGFPKNQLKERETDIFLKKIDTKQKVFSENQSQGLSWFLVNWPWMNEWMNTWHTEFEKKKIFVLKKRKQQWPLNQRNQKQNPFLCVPFVLHKI